MIKHLIPAVIIMYLMSSLTLPYLSLYADEQEEQNALEERELKFIVFWEGTNPKMTLADLAAYCAPVFWYSPDEPELGNKSGKDIRVPAAFPFEEQVDQPVVYYQVRNILVSEKTRAGAATLDEENLGHSVLDLSRIYGFEIDYNHYYQFEVGLGKHNHDTEQAQFKVYVHRYPDQSGTTNYQLYLLQATAKAHALAWYDNIYIVDPDNLNMELLLPFHIMVEEGKHASVTDMNGDGYYTPEYDVNVRTNDAWGLRDVIRTGELFSPKFEAWMAKVRRPEHKVLPPLPPDSPHRARFERNGEYAPENSVYELRPMPAPDMALPDENLAYDMSGYFVPGWPNLEILTNTKKFLDWWEAGNFIKSLAIAARVDNDQWGIAFSFPLLIVKNVEAPLVGGWLVNRIYLQDHDLRDFGYNILYTTSASRFLDSYFALGVEVDKFKVPGTDIIDDRTDFVFETGLKFRGNVKYSPLKFLGVLTEFWGARIGIKNRGFMDIQELTYVFEIGAGVW